MRQAQAQELLGRASGIGTRVACQAAGRYLRHRSVPHEAGKQLRVSLNGAVALRVDHRGQKAAETEAAEGVAGVVGVELERQLDEDAARALDGQSRTGVNLLRRVQLEVVLHAQQHVERNRAGA